MSEHNEDRRAHGLANPPDGAERKGRLLSVLLVCAVVASLARCATVTPGSSTVLVKGQDALSNSLVLYDEVMALHVAHSAQESPALYKALEVVRVSFPPAHRALSAALDAYKAGDKKDSSGLHEAVGRFLTQLESFAPEDSGWSIGVRLLRKAWEG